MCISVFVTQLSWLSALLNSNSFSHCKALMLLRQGVGWGRSQEMDPHQPTTPPAPHPGFQNYCYAQEQAAEECKT